MKNLLAITLFCVLGCGPSPQETYLLEKQVFDEIAKERDRAGDWAAKSASLLNEYTIKKLGVTTEAEIQKMREDVKFFEDKYKALDERFHRQKIRLKEAQNRL